MIDRLANNVSAVIDSFRTVFGNVCYILLSLAIFLAALLVAIWLPNLSFIGSTITSATLTLGQKVNLLWSSLGAFKTNFTLLSRTLTTLVIVLFAVNIGMLVFYLKRRVKLERAAGVSFGGMLSGFLGIGCAACGSVILSTLFGIGFTVGFITTLPLQGQEFGLLGVGILGFAIIQISKKIRDPMVCEIKTPKSRSDSGRQSNN